MNCFQSHILLNSAVCEDANNGPLAFWKTGRRTPATAKVADLASGVYALSVWSDGQPAKTAKIIIAR